MREEIEKEPLAKIRNLNDAIDTVLKKIQYLQQDKEKIESKLLHVSRKTKIAELFSGKYLVAITGLQGQGKSTLLKAFLELDGDYIPTNSGKGEVEPIIIKLQDDISSPKCYKYGFQNKTTRQEFCYEEISKEELKELAENGIKDNDAFYLEIRVPAKDRNMANKEFLLLPGLEPYNQEEDWQKNIEYYLEWCMSAIVVTRMEKLADSDTISFRDMLDRKIKNNYILAVSFCENKSEIELSDIKRQAGGVFFGDVDSKKVICTGARDGKLSCGREPFLKTLSSVKVAPREWRDFNIKELKKVIDRELGEVIKTISYSQSDLLSEDKYGEKSEIRKKFFKSFEKGSKRLTKDFENIAKAIDAHKKDFLENEGKNTLSALWEDFELASLSVNNKKLEERVQQHFNDQWRMEVVQKTIHSISSSVLDDEKYKEYKDLDLSDMEKIVGIDKYFEAYPAHFAMRYWNSIPNVRSRGDKHVEEMPISNNVSPLFDGLINKGLARLSGNFPALRAIEFASEIASIIKYPSERKKNLERILDIYTNNIFYSYCEWFREDVMGQAGDSLEKWFDLMYNFEERLEKSHTLTVAVSKLEKIKTEICEDLASAQYR